MSKKCKYVIIERENKQGQIKFHPFIRTFVGLLPLGLEGQVNVLEAIIMTRWWNFYSDREDALDVIKKRIAGSRRKVLKYHDVNKLDLMV